MSIQLADRSIKYPTGVCENLLVKINKFIFRVDFVVLEMNENELVLIILRRPFLAIDRAVIDVHEGKLSLRVGNETVTFNIRKSIKSKYSHDDYLHCANLTAKHIREQWVDTIDHDGEWMEAEEGRDSDELKELPEHLKYAFLQEDNKLPVVISSMLSATEKASLLEVLRNHKGAITWSITDIKWIDSSSCTYKIIMEDEFKPSIQHQR
ncbi:DNA-directed DNA polymerase [Tanacetum coccineum]